ncbi:MAG: DUF3461 family protein [Myxococcota bacterium]
MSENEFPQLTALGIREPQRIDRFHINSAAGSDHLRIVYARGKGEFFPVARTYHFPRVQRTAASGEVLESHPALRDAERELKALMEAKEDRRAIAKVALEELDLLKREVENRTAYIRELIEKL